MARVRLALDGLSVGDAFGECFFQPALAQTLLRGERSIPPAPWPYTDDTEMALGITEVLERHGRIHQDDLAHVFARRYRLNPHRGYGATAHQILAAIHRGERWHRVAPAAFGGQGSMGNGSAMRVAPVGAYFADDYAAVVEHARASAAVTHAHPDGHAGAVAVAIAAAWAWRNRENPVRSGTDMLETVLHHTPEGGTRRILVHAVEIPPEASPVTAASILGNGSKVVCWDSVPFALWCAARHHDHFENALWATLTALGDRDTTCAMVGGIVALATGHDAIPREWISAREPLC